MDALVILAVVVGVVVALVAGSRTSLTKYLLPRAVEEAIRKVVGRSGIDDASVDVSGGRFTITLRGSRGLSKIRVVRHGALTVSVANRPGSGVPTSGSFDVRTSAQDLPDDPRYDREELNDRIRRLIKAALEPKGFVPTTGDTTPTLLVRYYGAYEGRVTGADLDHLHGYVDKRLDGDQSDAPMTARHVYEKGSIVIDLIDAASGLLIWRGAALANIEVDVSQEEKIARTRDAIDTMFAEFPPKDWR